MQNSWNDYIEAHGLQRHEYLELGIHVEGKLLSTVMDEIIREEDSWWMNNDQ